MTPEAVTTTDIVNPKIGGMRCADAGLAPQEAPSATFNQGAQHDHNDD